MRRSEPILVEEPTPRKPDQKIADVPVTNVTSEYVADPLRKDGKANRKYHFSGVKMNLLKSQGFQGARMRRSIDP